MSEPEEIGIMANSTTWIVFAQLLIFNPQGNGDENELTEFSQKEFSTRRQCYQFLHDNYVFLDTALKRHAVRQNGQVIILGCGDRFQLSKISLGYDQYHKRG